MRALLLLGAILSAWLLLDCTGMHACTSNGVPCSEDQEVLRTRPPSVSHSVPTSAPAADPSAAARKSQTADPASLEVRRNVALRLAEVFEVRTVAERADDSARVPAARR